MDGLSRQLVQTFPSPLRGLGSRLPDGSGMVPGVKHAGPGTLARIAPLLDELRARPALREPRTGVFQLGSRAFLHFHDDPTGIFADVRLAGDFVRMPVTTASEQADLLEQIDACLSTRESRSRGRDRRRRRGGGRSSEPF